MSAISFTLPSSEADSGSCYGSRPLSDLDSAYVYAAPRWEHPRIVHRLGVRGMEGLRITLDLPLGHASVFVVTDDRSGNRSCPSNVIGVNPPTLSVPEPVAGDSVAYDVAGRKVKGKKPRGIYFWRKK